MPRSLESSRGGQAEDTYRNQAYANLNVLLDMSTDTEAHPLLDLGATGDVRIRRPGQNFLNLEPKLWKTVSQGFKILIQDEESQSSSSGETEVTLILLNAGLNQHRDGGRSRTTEGGERHDGKKRRLPKGGSSLSQRKTTATKHAVHFIDSSLPVALYSLLMVSSRHMRARSLG